MIDERFEGHRATANHPERPERISTLRRSMARFSRDQLVRLEAKAATPEAILLNHDRGLFEAVRATAGAEAFAFDNDTHTSADTFNAAMLASGSLLAVVDSVMAGDIDNGFALVRPPGHHAEADRAMGFCFFNNVAIAARHLIRKHRLERILIVDWDVHHGNGTQHSFFAQDDVFFISVHQYPLYPGSGTVSEWGVSAGAGYTLNVPSPAGFGDAEYAAIFDSLVVPAAQTFDPDFILVSAGFDCHHLDPLGGMGVTVDGFQDMTRRLLSVALECCQGRLAAVLEGGYSLQALAESVPVVMTELGGGEHSSATPRKHQAHSIIHQIRKRHPRFQAGAA